MVRLWMALILFGVVPARAQQAHIVYALSHCEGFLARMNPQAETVYFFTAGHCLPSVKVFDNPNNFVTQKDITPSKEIKVYGASNVQAVQILTGHYQTADFAVLKIKQTASDLKKEGIIPYLIAQQPARLGTAVSVINMDLNETNHCDVEHYPFQLTFNESVWAWSARLSSSCQLTHGWSGAGVLDSSTQKIYGLIGGGNETGDCTDYCQVERDGSRGGFKSQVYFTRLDFLHQATDSQGVIFPMLLAF